MLAWTRRSGVHACFALWTCVVVEGQVTARSRLVLSRLRYVCTAVVHRRVRKAFRTWLKPPPGELSNHVRSLIHRSAAAMRHRRVYKAMSAWTSLARTRAKNVRLLNHVIAELQGIGIRRGWYTWCLLFDSKVRLRAFIARMRRQEESRADERSWAARSVGTRID